ncbi:OmpH family outer membrane protein [Undibacterium sp. Ji83W]|uniref:OmpH family outer membrane protein n=1 Tax=Undibacterium sp. Ji83W TaxID=3413043 RepID=UPI003BF35F01
MSQHTTPTKLLQRLMVCAACVFSVAQAQAQDTKIAIFDSQRVMRESVPAKAAEAKLKVEFQKRGEELENLAKKLKATAEKYEKDAPLLSEADRVVRQREITELDQTFKRKQRSYNEDVNQRQNEEIASLVERAQKVIKQIAEVEKIDLVLQDSVYHSARIDITDKVLKALSK